MPTDRDVGYLEGVVRERVKARDKQHIAGKPIGVMQELVKICEPGGIVLDPFSGSASTGVACVREGYRYIGIEMVDAYDAVGRERLEGGTMAVHA